MRSLGHPGRQGREYSFSAFEQGYAYAARRIQLLQTVIAHVFARFHKFCSQLDTRGATSDYVDVKRVRRISGQLPLSTDQLAQQALPEGLGLSGGIERHGELGGARRAKIIGLASHSQHQSVVWNLPPRKELLSLRVVDRVQNNKAAFPVKLGSRPIHKSKSAVPSQDGVGQPLAMDVQSAGCDFVQRGLPYMSQGCVDQKDMVGAETAAQLCSQLEASGSASYNHDFMHHLAPEQTCKDSARVRFVTR